jgi:hypothetical protein
LLKALDKALDLVAVALPHELEAIHFRLHSSKPVPNLFLVAAIFSRWRFVEQTHEES